MVKGLVLVYVEAFVAENMLLCHYGAYGKLIGASPSTYTYVHIILQTGNCQFTHGYAHAHEGTCSGTVFPFVLLLFSQYVCYGYSSLFVL